MLLLFLPANNLRSTQSCRCWRTQARPKLPLAPDSVSGFLSRMGVLAYRTTWQWCL